MQPAQILLTAQDAVEEKHKLALQALRNLDYDELRDFVYLLEEDYLIGPEYGKRIRRLRRRNRLTASLRLALSAYLEIRFERGRQVISEAVRELQLLEPVEKRRTRINSNSGQRESVAVGHIQIKYIRRFVLSNPISRFGDWQYYGPYLYIRIWATGGGRTGQVKRLKSHYIGRKKLAERLESLLVGSPERKELEAKILSAYYDGTLEQLEEEITKDSGS